MPVRTRVLRPALWVDPATATLSAEAFRIYLGLATCTDDNGWLLWRPQTLAAQLLRFQPVARRERRLAQAMSELVAAGLLVVHPCGCAFLTYLWRDFRQSSGNHTTVVADFHASHTSTDEYVQGGTSPAPSSSSSSDSGLSSPSASSSHSGSSSASGSGSTSSLRATSTKPRSSDGQPTTTGDAPWNTVDPRWWPVRQALDERGYVLQPGADNGGLDMDRERLSVMVREDASLVVALVRNAPPDLHAGPHPFVDLVDYLVRQWDARAAGVHR